MAYPYPQHIKPCRVMVFVDGENLAMRYGCMLGANSPFQHVKFEKDVYVWASILNLDLHEKVNRVRTYYYTSVKGDKDRQDQIHDELQSMGIHAPRVFPRNRTKGSKRVDISLSVDMLSLAHTASYDAAVLVAGDGDYVPLVDAVEAQGRQVFVWFVSSGLSPALKRRADYFFNLDDVLLNKKAPQSF